MKTKLSDSVFTTQRLEAFSDGVIAIIITLMILEVKPPVYLEDRIQNIDVFVHRLIAYAMSFLMLGIYWVNHHNFFHKLKHGDRQILWLNLNLLFWLSLVPIPTAFLGAHHEKPIASVFYSVVLFMCSISFTWMGSYARKKGFFTELIPAEVHARNKRRNRLGLALYVIAIGLSFIHVYLAFAIFVFVASMYFMPKLGLQHKKNEELSISEIIAEDLYKVEAQIEDKIHDTLHPHEGKTKKD